MSKEKVQNILSQVDMSKIDLTSFRLSEKKFNELSTLYRNRVIISCVAVLIRKAQYPQEEVDVAFEMLEKVVNNPDLYSYSHIYSMERQAVDRAINDVTSRRNRSINDIKVKAIERRMKDAYKQMRKTIELALEHNNDFEQECDEGTVERCLTIAKEAIKDGKKKAAEKALQEAQAEKDKAKMRAAAQAEAATAQVDAFEVFQEVQTEVVPHLEANKTKTPFWKKLFCKK